MSKTEKPVVTAVWDAQATTIFCQICVEEVKNGNKPLGGLNAKGYHNLGEKFLAMTGRPYNQRQLKNRWDALKGLYDFWLSLLANTGLDWDATLGTVTSDEFWDLITKGHKERKALRYGEPANLKDLEVMFDKSEVSGLSACIPGEQDKTSRINLDDEDDKDEQGNEECSKKRGPAVKGLKRKAAHTPSPKKGKNHMVRVMNRMVDDVISSNSVTSRALNGDITLEAIREVMNLAKEAGAAEGSDEHFMATKLFVKAENRAMFLTFETKEGRFNWLKRCYEDRKK